MSKIQSVAVLLLCTVMASCNSATSREGNNMTDQPRSELSEASDAVQSTLKPAQAAKADESSETRLATFGAGCFWCVEAVFQELDGVIAVESGYTGGAVENPTYQAICRGNTGHAEVCHVRYDPSRVSFEELLEVFWKTHDPTTLNRQGSDVGTQYRSAIFFHDEEQRKLGEKYKRELDASGAWDAPIVTEITKFEKFYPAEKYHQNYYRDNPEAGYCAFVIKPKLDKFRQVFRDKLKP